MRYIFAVLLIISAGCSRNFGIQRNIAVKEGRGVEMLDEGCQRARLGDIEITAEPVTSREWNSIRSYAPYNKIQDNADTRFPRLSIFQCVVTCTGNRAIPLSDIHFSLRAGDVEKKELANAEIEKRLSSPAYGGFNLKNLFSWKRLLGPGRCSGAIRYDRDIIDYRFEFLAPGDSLVRMVAMDWLPVENREMTLKAEMNAGADKKSIDFEFTRKEYRTKGKHFTNPDSEGDGVRR